VSLSSLYSQDTVIKHYRQVMALAPDNLYQGYNGYFGFYLL